MSDAVTRLNAALEGRYRIERQLGEGGMATVYLADDLKHERNVALKVLKPELAAVVGAGRFLAEITTTANLQHPHILPLFDSGQADGFLFYVMPYVEGESLRERLDREHQLPVDEAVRIASDVASALDYAHRHGVIHRDVKPGNILLSETGEPLVSDFGIALAVSAGGGDRLTETGLSLGTPHYMSPEQATGDQNIGPATDTYALGCVLYEMLVGEPPYTGSTPQAVLGKIVMAEPEPVTAHRKAVPANVEAATAKALEKLPADRFTGADGFVRALKDSAFRHRGIMGADRSSSGLSRPAIAFAALAVVFALVSTWALLRLETPGPIRVFESPFREGQRPVGFGPDAFDLSSDGSMLVYMGPAPAGEFQLWMRRWDDPEASPIRDTELGLDPAIAPDGRHLAFEQSDEIKVVAFEGGGIQLLGPGSQPHWGPEGQVYFRSSSGTIVRVPPTGGEAQAITGPVEVTHIEFLPRGDAALIAIGDTVHALHLNSGEMTSLIGGAQPRYASSGHLTFTSDRTLMAARFDPRSLELRGDPVSMIQGVTAYDISQEGDLVYARTPRRETVEDVDTELVWITRSGAVTSAGWRFDRAGNNNTYTLRLSPDGTTVALWAVTDGNGDIWLKPLPEGAPRRLTYAEGSQHTPSWSRDGRAVTYLSDGNIWSVAADGTGTPGLIHDGERRFREVTGSRDGSWLVLRTPSRVISFAPGQPERDLLALRPGIDSVARSLVATPEFAETSPALSDDGRWLAYSSNETGSFEVWVRPFPDVDGGKHRVSFDGGHNPLWAHSGDELFYHTPENHLVSAQIDRSSGFSVVAQHSLFVLPSDIVTGGSTNFYDVSADDQRFLMGRTMSSAGEDDFDVGYVLVHSFLEELRARVPG